MQEGSVAISGDKRTDEALIRQIIGGDGDAFKVFIELYQNLVFHVVYRLVDNRTECEDICQDVFIRIYQNLAGFRGESKVSTWVARIAHNTALNHLEKKRPELFEGRSEEDDDPMASVRSDADRPDRVTEKRETYAQLKSEIEKLKPIYRTIISLYHWEEMSYQEIGEVLGIPMGTVKNYLFRARAVLKERLQEINRVD